MDYQKDLIAIRQCVVNNTALAERTEDAKERVFGSTQGLLERENVASGLFDQHL